MNELLEQWKIRMINSDLSKNTIETYLLGINEFFDWIKKNKNVDSIDLEIIKSMNFADFDLFMTYLRGDKNNSASTRSLKTSIIHTFYKFLVKMDLISDKENNSKKLNKPKLPKTNASFLNEEEAQSLIHASMNKRKGSIRDTAILMLFINTGLRLNELCSINVNDIKEDCIKVVGKGNKERVVNLNEETISAINDYISIRPKVENEALFLSERKIRIGRSAIQNMTKSVLKSIGRQDCSVHKLRHTSATLMLSGGANVRNVQEILGHNSLDTTMRYLHCIDKDRKFASDCIKIKKI